MYKVPGERASRPFHATPGRVAAILALVAVLETSYTLFVTTLPALNGVQGDAATVRSLHLVLLQFVYFPRLAVSLLCGAALGLATALFQYILRNVLAEPTTLGVSTGAGLALAIASLWFPSALSLGREWIALAGSAITMVFVYAIAARSGFSPLGLILAGLVITLCAGSVASVLAVLFADSMAPVFIWQSGALNQNGWGGVVYLLPHIAVAAGLLALCARPLAALELGDDTAQGLGIPVVAIRLTALAIATALAAAVVSQVGMIGFVGLGGAVLARITGARTFNARLVWSSVIGACLLWVADQTVQAIALNGGWDLPTGTATALLGAPLLIWLLPGIRDFSSSARVMAGHMSSPPESFRRMRFGLVAVLLVFMLGLTLDVNRHTSGWQIESWPVFRSLLELRVPRIAASLSAGAMLAVAGVLMQRLSANPMASPEVLGISSGALLGVVVLVLLMPMAGKAPILLAASVGAFVTVSAMFSLGRRDGFSPQQLVLAGIAVTTIVGAVVALVMAGGGMRSAMLQAWMSGSTSGVEAPDAFVSVVVALLGLSVVPLASRPLEILPLGSQSASSVGLDVPRNRKLLLIVIAVLTGAATLIVGPVSFIGLIAPHIARLSGLRRAWAQAWGGALIGALLMVMADWLGRNLLFPNQVPAGIFVTFVGGPYFLILMWKQK
ncbi:Fe(3+)-hydroxamate ABC transporter permease FhuB [Burkholderia stagnalis]